MNERRACKSTQHNSEGVEGIWKREVVVGYPAVQWRETCEACKQGSQSCARRESHVLPRYCQAPDKICHQVSIAGAPRVLQVDCRNV